MTKIEFNEPSVGTVTTGEAALKCISNAKGAVGVWAECSSGFGVFGVSDTERGVFGVAKTSGFGVVGSCDGPGTGVWGVSVKEGIGVKGDSDDGFGVWGVSKTGRGIMGNAVSSGFGVVGSCDGPGTGVWGVSVKEGIGVKGDSDDGFGVWGVSKTGRGIMGNAVSSGFGVVGSCDGEGVGVWGVNNPKDGIGVKGESEKGIGIYGIGRIAGRFDGNVEVSGDIKLVNADCAEDFDVADSESKDNIEAGTVMVLTENGSLQSSCQEYDKKVAGIISGASGYKPAIVLDRQEQKNEDRLPIALMGKVYCKVDARHASIEIGDLLTTSSTKGYAMKAQDPMKAFGAVIGKALGSIKDGMGMIPVLVSLQ